MQIVVILNRKVTEIKIRKIKECYHTKNKSCMSKENSKYRIQKKIIHDIIF